MPEQDLEETVSDGFLTVEKAVKFSSIGRTNLYKLMGNGELPYATNGNRRLIPKRAIMELLKKSMTRE